MLPQTLSDLLSPRVAMCVAWLTWEGTRWAPQYHPELAFDLDAQDAIATYQATWHNYVAQHVLKSVPAWPLTPPDELVYCDVNGSEVALSVLAETDGSTRVRYRVHTTVGYTAVECYHFPPHPTFPLLGPVAHRYIQLRLSDLGD